MEAPMQQPAQAPQGQPQGAPQGGGASQLVNQIHQGISTLLQLMSKSQGVDPKVMEEGQKVLQAYEEFISMLGGEKDPSAGEGQEGESHGPAPMEAGVAKVKPSL